MRRQGRIAAGMVITAMMAVLFSGCSVEQSKKILRVAYVAGPTELVHKAASRLAKLVEATSDGAIEVRLYPAGQLGNENEIIEGLKLRSVDVVITGCAVVGWYAPEYGLVEAPFVWRDYDHIENVWDGPIGQELKDTMHQAAGIDMRALWFRGPRYLTTTSQSIHSPADLSGMKLRVPELEVYMKSWRAFGANVTPLPFNDMFMALKLGVVEGQENPLATIYGNNLQEVQDYIMETRHLIGFYVVSTGPHFRSRFSEDERAQLIDALREATDWHNQELERSESDYRELLTEAGVEFIEVDRQAFQQIAEAKIPSLFEDVWKPGLYQRIISSP